MSDIENLRNRLADAHAFFVRRGLEDWASLTKQALENVEKDEFSFLEDLWLKFGPTCDVDDLFITQPHLQLPPISEDEANEINNELAEIVNEVFSAIEKVRDSMKQGNNWDGH